MNQTTPIGLEPTTSAVTGRRSNQLSHEANVFCGSFPQNRTQKSVSLYPVCPLYPFFFHATFTQCMHCLPIPFRISLRPISSIQLSTLLHLHPCPIYLVVSKGSYPLLRGISHLEGGFTLRCLQRLSLPDLATLPWRWSPTGPPAVRPSRSSRTKDSSSQISCAHAG